MKYEVYIKTFFIGAILLLTAITTSIGATQQSTEVNFEKSMLTSRATVLLVPDSTSDTVKMFNPYNGTYMGDIIDGTGLFSTPINAIGGPDGNIYVSDQVADSVFVFNSAGTYLYTYANGSDGLNNIRGIDFRNGHLFVTSGDDYVAEFSGPHTRLPDFINDGTDPFDILFLADGRSLLADIQGTTDNVRLYDANGTFISQLFSVNFPEQIQVDSLSPGAFLNAGFSANVITDFELSGTIVQTTTFSGGRGVYRLGNGNLLCTNGNGILEVEPGTGTIIQTESTGNGRFIELYSTENSPPNIPSNPNPPNAATTVSLTADISWVGGDPNGDPVTYDVYFGTTSPPPKVINNQSTTSYDPGTMSFLTTHYWQIVAWDDSNATTTGPQWHFTTRGNVGPNIPSNPTPPDQGINIGITVDLSWTGGDPDGDPVTYDVYFGTTSPPPLVTTNQTFSIYDTGTMSFLTTYYWKIVAWDNYGETTSGPQWQFTTRGNAAPNMPSSPVPPDQVTDVDIDMDISWTGGDPDGDSVTYDVYFGTASYPPLEAEDLTVTTYDVGTLDCITTYYWKIVATDSFGAITEGPIWSFTTERLNATPTIPDISGKVNGKAGTPYDYTFISTDEDIEDVWYYIEWGDGSIEEWIGPYASGEEAIVSHTWTVKDTYTIRAKARDAYGLESDWGLLEVSMPILKGMFITTFLECIANWFPLLYRFISQFIL